MMGASGPSLRCAVGARRPGCPLCASCGGATPRATEIFLDPGIRLAHQLLDGADLNTLVHQNRNPVADGVERVDVVGDPEDGQPRDALKVAEQVVAVGGADGGGYGRRLVPDNGARGRA